MAKILERYLDILPKLQAKKVEDELRKNPSLTRDPATFRAAYQAELRAFLASDNQLRTELIELLEDTDRESELMNYMIRTMASDLSALSSEADALSSLKDMEIQVMQGEVVSKLRRAVSEAELEVERMETIRGNVSGLRDAIVDNFSSSTNRLSRSEQLGQDLFVDPKTNREVGPIFDSPSGNYGLTLPIDTVGSIAPTAIREIQAADIREGEDRLLSLGAGHPSTSGLANVAGNLNNIIDRRQNTFWNKILFTTEKPATGALSTLEISLGPNVQLVNFIEIQPSLVTGQEIIRVEYLDENLFIRTLALPEAALLDRPVKLIFDEFRARKISVTLRQKAFSTLLPPRQTESQRVYRFGIDNILVGDASYLKRGYYVSRTLEATEISKLYLDVNWSARSSGQASEEQQDPTVEFWVAFRERDQNGAVVFSKTVPISPVGEGTRREVVEVADTDLAHLSFSVSPTIADNSPNFYLYKDSVEVLRPADYTIISNSDNPSDIIEEGCDLNVVQGYNRQSELVVQYLPLFKQLDIAPTVLVDSTGRFQFNQDNSITISRPPGSRAASAEVNLIIVLRGTGNTKSTPIVEKYTLSVG